jgi:hypothetical protein
MLFAGVGGWGIKRPISEVSHSPTPSTEVKNERRYKSTPICPYGLHKYNFIISHIVMVIKSRVVWVKYAACVRRDA